MDSERAAALCDKLLQSFRLRHKDDAVWRELVKRPDDVIFWPEDFVVFFTAVALEAGIDVRTYGTRLSPKSLHPEYIPGMALRTVAEVASVYVEHPHALTLFTVQRTFLVTMTAAIIGIATGKATSIDPTLGGAIGGVGALLINVLAQRYIETAEEPETDWLEEFILTTLDRHGPHTVKELHDLTHIYSPLLSKTLRGLIKKQLIVRDYKWDGGRRVLYRLP